MRIFIILLLITLSFSANINTTKKEIIKTKYYIYKMNKILDSLAYDIHQKEHNLQKLNKQINTLDIQIKNLENELKNSNQKLSTLNDLKRGYEDKIKNIQDYITNFISENYFINSIKPENINDLVNKEISQAILKKYSTKINSLITQHKQLFLQIQNINKKINNILNTKKELTLKKEQLYTLLKKQKKELILLKNKKIKYKEKLQALIQKQRALQHKLVKLNIIKKRASKNITSINVKKIGSVYFTPKIANYYGPKTIPPVQGKIIKRFGSYVDPIYKIRIYNDSITIKPYKPNSVVRSILNGKVIYIGTSNDKKIIIIRHKHDLFSIYANLDKISPILKKGSYVKKGQIIARVKNSLEFEVTYKERPINPIKVISLK